MPDIKRFISTLVLKHCTSVSYNDIGIETLYLWHDEIDDYLVPMEQLKHLPNPLQMETISAIDGSGIEWIFGTVQDRKKGKTLYEVWIRDGERIESVLYE